jgi:hypothetical protein
VQPVEEKGNGSNTGNRLISNQEAMQVPDPTKVTFFPLSDVHLELGPPCLCRPKHVATSTHDATRGGAGGKWRWRGRKDADEERRRHQG